MTSTPSDIPTPDTAPLFALPENFDVVAQMEKIQTLEAQDAVNWALTFGPGLFMGFTAFVLMLVAKRTIIRALVRGGQNADSISGWRYWLVPFIQKISVLLLLVISISIGLQFIPTPDLFARPLKTVLGLTIFLQIGLIATTVLKLRTQQMVDKATNKQYDPTRVTVAATMAMIGQIGIWVVVLLLSLQTIGMDVTTLVAGLGIGGVAIAFAFKSILEDVFASLSIAFDKPFVIGDYIISGEHMGTVERIGMKNIRIRSLTGEQIVINNNDILASRIRNFGRMFERRVLFTLGVEYGTPAEKLRALPEILKTLIEAQPHTRFDRSHFKEYGPSSLLFETVYFMTVPDYKIMMDTQQTINLSIYEMFERAGISFAFPTQTIHMHTAEKAA